jgi:hypothetical protein
MADGEIEDCDALKAAVDKHEPGDTAEERRLIKRSIELGCTEHIPDEWGVDVDNG